VQNQGQIGLKVTGINEIWNNDRYKEHTVDAINYNNPYRSEHLMA